MEAAVESLKNQEVGKAIGQVLPNIETKPYYAFCKGYYFYGWNTQADGNGKYYEIGTKPDDLEITLSDDGNWTKLYAIWKPLQYQLRFNVNHDRNHTGFKGAVPSTISNFSFTSGEDEIKLDESYMNYVCSLDEFLGWSLKTTNVSDSDIIFKADGTSAYSGVELYQILLEYGMENAQNTRGALSVNLYDVWDADCYTVKFEKIPPEGQTLTGDMESISVYGNNTTGEEIPSSEGKLSCDGYTLLGWATEQNSTDIQFAADGKGKITGVKALKIFLAQGGTESAPAEREIHLYPVWVNSYQVTLTEATKAASGDQINLVIGDETGGKASGPSCAETIELYDTQVITASTGISAKCSRGYQFDGWKTVDSEGALSEGYVALNADLSDFVYKNSLYGSELILAACFEKKDYLFTMDAGENCKVTFTKNGDTDHSVVTEELQTNSTTYQLEDSLSVQITEKDPLEHPISDVCLKGGEDEASDDIVFLNLLTLKQNAEIQTDSQTGSNIYTLNLQKLISASPMKTYWAEKGLNGTYRLTVACVEKKVAETYTVTATCSEHGTITPMMKKAKDGVNVVVTATPNAGYCVTKFTMKSNGSTTEKTLKVYTSDPQTVTCTQATEVYAEFALIPEIYTISKKDTIHGTVSISTTEAPAGETVTVRAYPSDDYRVRAVYVNDILVARTSTYSFSVKEDAEIYVVFEEGGSQYTITGSAGSHGEISIDEELVEKGEDLTVEITPDAGYKISKLYVDNKSVAVQTKYTFENVKDDHTIRATFTTGTESYTITGTAGYGGNISIGSTEVDAGEDLRVSISANTGYRIRDVLVDGSSVGAVSSYTFTDVEEEHTIKAVFEVINTTYSGQYGMVNDGEGMSMTGSTFTDVNTGNWFYQGVRYVVEKGMAIPVSKNYFGARQDATRAEIVYMLYQYDGAPSVSGNTSFGDVSSSAWYAKAVAWAAGNGIVSGQNQSTFNPNGSVTREQLSAILYRYARYKGVNVTNTGDYMVSAYSDKDYISSYAKDAVNWICNAGLLSGRTETQLEPRGIATKAELSVMVMRFCKSL